MFDNNPFSACDLFRKDRYLSSRPVLNKKIGGYCAL